MPTPEVLDRVKKEAQLGLHGGKRPKNGLYKPNGKKPYTYTGILVNPEVVQALREEIHVHVDRYFDKAFDLGFCLGREKMSERLGELVTDMEFDLYGEPHHKSPVKKKRRLKTDSKGQKTDSKGVPVTVSTAASLQGRYMGLMNTVSKGDAEKAKAMRANKGLTEALSFLEKKRRISKGAKEKAREKAAKAKLKN